MEKKISLPKAFLVICGVLFAIGFYYFGVMETFEFCAHNALFFVYFCLATASTAGLVFGVCAAVTSVITEVRYGPDYARAHARYRRGGLFLESVGVSVVAAFATIFFGHLSAVYAEYVVGASFAELFRFENLFPVFWGPYLFSYVVSFVLGAAMFLDKKYYTWRKGVKRARAKKEG